MLDRPANLHERRNRDRNITNREVAQDESGGIQGARTEDACAPGAQVLNAAGEFFRRILLRRWRHQAAGMYIKYLRKTLMLPSFFAGKMAHRPVSCPKILLW